MEHWSRQVNETSNALDLEPGVFTWNDPVRIAASLRRSAEASTRRKTTPFRSAMAMLNFYVNRAGRNLPPERRAMLERARQELRSLYGKDPQGARSPDEPARSGVTLNPDPPASPEPPHPAARG